MRSDQCVGMKTWKTLAMIGLILGLADATLAATADAAFETLARSYIEDYLRENPESATSLGDHRFDGRLSDYSAAARNREQERLVRYRDELGRIDHQALGRVNRIDAQILALEIEASLFSL